MGGRSCPVFFLLKLYTCFSVTCCLQSAGISPIGYLMLLLILYLVLAAYFFAVLQYYSADNYHNIILIISMINIIHIIFIISIKAANQTVMDKKIFGSNDV